MSTEDALKKYKEYNLGGVIFTRQGVENFTEADFLEEAKRNKAWREFDEARLKVMREQGWEFCFPHCSLDSNGPFGNGRYATDPLTKETVTHETAFTLQEERTPGLLPSEPTFDTDWKPPHSTFGLFDTPESPVVHGSLNGFRLKRFDMIERHDSTKKLQVQAAEDEAVFKALDSLKP